MEARFLRIVAVILAAGLSLGAGARSTNFIVDAPDPEFARQVAGEAERFRKELAVEWLGRELPPWHSPCPISVQVGENLGAGGATSFSFDQGEVFGWKMEIQGSRERVLDSVLPHEVNHTIFATYFRRPLPRWADEGACTTVEHASERQKQQKLLIQFLKTERGIPFSSMFAMKEYPRDVLPLYSQGYSLTRFFIAQGGKRKFVRFLGDGMAREDWVGAVAQHYGYGSLRELQDTWVEWVRRGSAVEEFSNTQVAAAEGPAPEQSFDADANAPPAPNPFAGGPRGAVQPAMNAASPGVTPVGLDASVAANEYATPAGGYPNAAGGYGAAANVSAASKKLDDSGWVAVGSRYPRQGAAANPAALAASEPNAYAPSNAAPGGYANAATQPQSQQVLLEWRRPDDAGPIPGQTPPAQPQYAGPAGAAPAGDARPPLAFDAAPSDPFRR